jgi:hypothetical protein
VALQRQVDHRIQQRMSGADEGGQRLPGKRDQPLLERDALVARQDRLPEADHTVAVRTGAGTWVTS